MPKKAKKRKVVADRPSVAEIERCCEEITLQRCIEEQGTTVSVLIQEVPLRLRYEKWEQLGYGSEVHACSNVPFLRDVLHLHQRINIEILAYVETMPICTVSMLEQHVLAMERQSNSTFTLETSAFGPLRNSVLVRRLFPGTWYEAGPCQATEGDVLRALASMKRRKDRRHTAEEIAVAIARQCGCDVQDMGLRVGNVGLFFQAIGDARRAKQLQMAEVKAKLQGISDEDVRLFKDKVTERLRMRIMDKKLNAALSIATLVLKESIINIGGNISPMMQPRELMLRASTEAMSDPRVLEQLHSLSPAFANTVRLLEENGFTSEWRNAVEEGLRKSVSNMRKSANNKAGKRLIQRYESLASVFCKTLCVGANSEMQTTQLPSIDPRDMERQLSQVLHCEFNHLQRHGGDESVGGESVIGSTISLSFRKMLNQIYGIATDERAFGAYDPLAVLARCRELDCIIARYFGSSGMEQSNHTGASAEISSALLAEFFSHVAEHCGEAFTSERSAALLQRQFHMDSSPIVSANAATPDGNAHTLAFESVLCANDEQEQLGEFDELVRSVPYLQDVGKAIGWSGSVAALADEILTSAPHEKFVVLQSGDIVRIPRSATVEDAVQSILNGRAHSAASAIFALFVRDPIKFFESYADSVRLTLRELSNGEELVIRILYFLPTGKLSRRLASEVMLKEYDPVGLWSAAQGDEICEHVLTLYGVAQPEGLSPQCDEVVLLDESRNVVRSGGAIDHEMQTFPATLITGQKDCTARGQFVDIPSDETVLVDDSKADEVIGDIRRKFCADSDDPHNIGLKDAVSRACENLSGKLYSSRSHYVMELVQNADDNSYAKSTTPKLVFERRKDCIITRSNEVGFTESQVHSICNVGSSSKKHIEGYVGEKGIGFKSVFVVSETPRIFSGAFKFMFDIRNSPLGYIVPTSIRDEEPLPLSHSHVGLVDSAFHWRTQLELPLRTGLNVGQELYDAVNPKLLLFLRKLREISVVDTVKEQYLRYRIFKSPRDGETILAGATTSVISLETRVECLSTSSVVNTSEEYLSVELRKPVPAGLDRNGIQLRHSTVIVALPLDKRWWFVAGALDDDHEEGDVDDALTSESVSEEEVVLNWSEVMPQESVYAFLPLQQYGFRFIVQGDFQLQSSREAISTESKWNHWLRSLLPSAFEESVRLLLNSQCASDHPLFISHHVCQLLPKRGELQGFFSGEEISFSERIRSLPFLLSTSKQWCAPTDIMLLPRGVQMDEIECLSGLSGERARGSTAFKFLHPALSNAVLPIEKQLGIARVDVRCIVSLLQKRLLGGPVSNTWLCDWAELLFKISSTIDKRSREVLRSLPLVQFVGGSDRLPLAASNAAAADDCFMISASSHRLSRKYRQITKRMRVVEGEWSNGPVLSRLLRMLGVRDLSIDGLRDILMSTDERAFADEEDYSIEEIVQITAFAVRELKDDFSSELLRRLPLCCGSGRRVPGNSITNSNLYVLPTKLQEILAEHCSRHHFDYPTPKYRDRFGDDHKNYEKLRSFWTSNQLCSPKPLLTGEPSICLALREAVEALQRRKLTRDVADHAWQIYMWLDASCKHDTALLHAVAAQLKDEEWLPIAPRVENTGPAEGNPARAQGDLRWRTAAQCFIKSFQAMYFFDGVPMLYCPKNVCVSRFSEALGIVHAVDSLDFVLDTLKRLSEGHSRSLHLYQDLRFEHLKQLYRLLAQRSAESEENRKRIQTEMSKNPLVFVLHSDSSKEDSQEEFHRFFVEHMKVKFLPRIEDYCEALSFLASKNDSESRDRRHAILNFLADCYVQLVNAAPDDPSVNGIRYGLQLTVDRERMRKLFDHAFFDGQKPHSGLYRPQELFIDDDADARAVVQSACDQLDLTSKPVFAARINAPVVERMHRTEATVEDLLLPCGACLLSKNVTVEHTIEGMYPTNLTKNIVSSVLPFLQKRARLCVENMSEQLDDRIGTFFRDSLNIMSTVKIDRVVTLRGKQLPPLSVFTALEGSTIFVTPEGANDWRGVLEKAFKAACASIESSFGASGLSYSDFSPCIELGEQLCQVMFTKADNASSLDEFVCTNHPLLVDIESRAQDRWHLSGTDLPQLGEQVEQLKGREQNLHEDDEPLSQEPSVEESRNAQATARWPPNAPSALPSGRGGSSRIGDRVTSRDISDALKDGLVDYVPPSENRSHNGRSSDTQQLEEDPDSDDDLPSASKRRGLAGTKPNGHESRPSADVADCITDRNRKGIEEENGQHTYPLDRAGGARPSSSRVKSLEPDQGAASHVHAGSALPRASSPPKTGAVASLDDRASSKVVFVEDFQLTNPPSIAQSGVSAEALEAIGRLGEYVAQQFLLQNSGELAIKKCTWLNESVETGAHWDFEVELADGGSVRVEVKSTTEMSLSHTYPVSVEEVQASVEPGEWRYWILFVRLHGGTPLRASVRLVRDVLHHWKSGCLRAAEAEYVDA